MQRPRARILKLGAPGRILREDPRLARIEIVVDSIRKGHDFAHRLADIAGFVVFGHLTRHVARLPGDRRSVIGVPELAAKMLRDEAGSPARNIDVLADQIAVHARDEVFGVEVEILDVRVQLGTDVIAQPLGVHPDLEITQRADAGPAGLGHFLAGHRDEAMGVDVIGNLVRRSRELQHGRPEQRVKVDDVLADEMQLLGIGSGEKLRESACLAARARLAGVEVVLQRREIADGRVQPHVEILAGRIGDRNAEVRSIAGNVPVVERLISLAGEPLAGLVDHLRLQPPRRVEPAGHELDALRIR